ncbi:S8 family serine peptidase [Polystyrenella longa]|uniref:S8 family serine peptidase n=1 Tax=Polystyrenella longa TaxID=2528007 RepID=UPI0018D2643E|nr:S8 family serine peptidase [Polystyrenella longa]
MHSSAGTGAYQHIEVAEPRVMLSASPTGGAAWLNDDAPATPLDLRVNMSSEMPLATMQVDAAYESWKNEKFTIDSYALDEITFESGSDISIQDEAMHNLINLDDVYANTSYRGTGYSVAVLDTGVDYTHAALGGGWGNRVIAGYDFVNNDSDPMDDQGHGTHVAGIIGGYDETNGGIANDVNIIALKVLDANGSGSFGDVEEALQWVADNQETYNIVAVNMSLGAGNYSTNPYTFMEDELSTLIGQGVFIAAATGNDFYSLSSAQGLGYPAISDQTVSVGAVWDGSYGGITWGSGARDITTGADRITSFTQRNSSMDILAPGALITAAGLGGGFVSMGGTSMATPVIAGAAALLHEAAQDNGKSNLANQTSLLQLMQDTGVDINDGDDEDDNVTNTNLNFKRLDLYAAIQELITPQAAPVDFLTITDGIAEITGTAGDDTFVISFSGTDMNVTRNDVSTTIDTTAVTEINLSGDAGTDSLTYTGRSVVDSFKMWQNRLQHTLTDLVFDSDTLESIILNGGGGADTALMYDTVGNDTLAMTANAVQMTGTGYSNTINGINTVTAYSNNGGTDSVTFTDTVAGDYFVSKYNQAYMTTGDYRNTAVNFESGIATSSNGGSDRAWFYDSTGNDTLTMAGSTVNMTGTNFNNTANNFYRVDAYGDNGGTDTATFTDTSGNDRYYGDITYSYMSGTGYYNRVNNFDTVTVNATTGGTDRADFYGTDADESFTATGQAATLTGNGVTINLNGFDLVAANMTYGSGTDDATFNDIATKDYFKTYSDVSFMYGSGYENYAYGFDSVSGNSSNGGNDQVYMIDSSGDDTLTLSPNSATMTGTGFSNSATGFYRIDTYSNQGGTDTATFNDSSGDDQARAYPTRAYMIGSGYVNYIRDYEEVIFQSSNGGFDKAYFYDSTEADTFTASPTAASMLGTGYNNSGTGFDWYIGYAVYGGTDQANHYDSAGNDTYSAYTDKTIMTGTGYKIYTFGFENTDGYATAGGTGDRAYLYDSSGDDTYTSTLATTSLTGTGFDMAAHGFDRVDGIAESGGTDTANIYDTDGNDNMYLRDDYSALLATGFSSYAYGFDRVNAYADNGGTDRARYYDSAGDDTYTSDQTEANMIGTGFANYSYGFDIYIVNGDSGGDDTANLDDSTGDDTVTVGISQTTFSGNGITTQVNNFETVNVTATNGGTDSATITGSDTADDSVSWGDSNINFSTSTFAATASGFETIDALDIGLAGFSLNDTSATETFTLYSDRVIKDNGTNILTIWSSTNVTINVTNGGNDVFNIYDTNLQDRAELDNTIVYMVYENSQPKWKRITGSNIDTVNLYASNSGVDTANQNTPTLSYTVNYFGGWVEYDDFT